MTHPLVSFVAFQVCWFACVGGAARGLPWLGPLAVAASNLAPSTTYFYRFHADVLVPSLDLHHLGVARQMGHRLKTLLDAAPPLQHGPRIRILSKGIY